MWWNLHFQLAKYACYIFVSSPFHLFYKIAVGFAFIPLGVWVKNPYLKKCYLIFRPKLSCTKVQPSFVSHIRWSAVKCVTSQGLNKVTQLVHCDALDQLDLLLCCVSDYVLMKQTHPFWMKNCDEDHILVHSYTYLVNVIMAIHVISSQYPKIFVSINCNLPLLVELWPRRCNLLLINLI